MKVSSVVVSTATIVLIGLLSGCARNEAAQVNEAPAVPVSVAKTFTKSITDFDEFSGRLTAVERVEIRPRVSGFVASAHFNEGGVVKKGDVLFTIDPRPYQAELKRAQADLARAKAQRTLAQSDRERAEKLYTQHAISREEYDSRTAGNEQGEANVQAAEAALDSAALNLSFTRITAPINGVVGRAEITPGNLVATGQTLLTTVVSVDPIYVEFDGDERTYRKYMELAQAAKVSKQVESKTPIWIGVGDESGFPHQGTLVFMDNELDQATGTIRARGRISNSDRRFTPGMFARVRVVGSERYDATLVNDSAVGTDQNIKYVFVVGSENKVEYRPIKLGPLVEGMRVVRDGLQPGESIVVNGMQRVRPGVVVAPQAVAMSPSLLSEPTNAVVAQNVDQNVVQNVGSAQ
jgi:RND family efflux transporter MFP subunit